jgi:CRP-like cAMP-binding protein
MENDLHPTENRLLGLLPETELARLKTQLVPVEMTPGFVVYEAGEHLDHVYFPTTSIVSLRQTMPDGKSAEIAVVGNDGLVGTELFMGDETTTNTAVVQTPGEAYRLSAPILKEEFRQAGVMQWLLLRYTLALFAQIAQTVVCNQYHSTDQRLCRWLLLGIDRLPSNEPKVSPELLANALCLRRASTRKALGQLEDAGVIRCGDSYIEVLDRRSLENRACECYRVVKREFDRLLPDLAAP